MAISIKDPETERLARELPRLEDRTPDEIIGYDENGLPR